MSMQAGQTGSGKPENVQHLLASEPERQISSVQIKGFWQELVF